MYGSLSAIAKAVGMTQNGLKDEWSLYLFVDRCLCEVTSVCAHDGCYNIEKSKMNMSLDCKFSLPMFSIAYANFSHVVKIQFILLMPYFWNIVLCFVRLQCLLQQCLQPMLLCCCMLHWKIVAISQSVWAVSQDDKLSYWKLQISINPLCSSATSAQDSHLYILSSLRKNSRTHKPKCISSHELHYNMPKIPNILLGTITAPNMTKTWTRCSNKAKSQPLLKNTW